MWSRWASSSSETEAIGAELARGLRPGDLVLVSGDLGAGKTTFIRGACRALGVIAPVTSPTFTIGQLYAGDPDVAHLDLYRLDGAEPGLLDDYLTPDRVAFVEWPDRAAGAFGDPAARVTIEHAGEDRRRVTVDQARDPGTGS